MTYLDGVNNGVAVFRVLGMIWMNPSVCICKRRFGCTTQAKESFLSSVSHWPQRDVQEDYNPFCLFNFVADVACRGNALGMENSKISGGGILASSWYSPYVDFLPSQGRLNNNKGSWCPKAEDQDKHPYLQVRSGNNSCIESEKKRII